MPEQLYDLFISYSRADWTRYIQRLTDQLSARGVTFWLDSLEVNWGDSIPLRINAGLRKSRYVLLCLSGSFLRRPWPEAEMSSALSSQNEIGKKRVLPLILDSRDRVFEEYPLLSSLAYREYQEPLDPLVEELAGLVAVAETRSTEIVVTIESVHTNKALSIKASPRASVYWLVEEARRGLSLSEEASVGAVEPFRVRWVLVDAQADEAWQELPRREKRRTVAMVQGVNGPRRAVVDRARLEDIGVYDGVVFHLYAIEDESHPLPSPKTGN